jgi:hypothetical protein
MLQKIVAASAVYCLISSYGQSRGCFGLGGLRQQIPCLRDNYLLALTRALSFRVSTTAFLLPWASMQISLTGIKSALPVQTTQTKTGRAVCLASCYWYSG